MDFLIDYGIKESTIRKIKLNNSNQIISDAEWNMERVVSSIAYLESIGVMCIDKILINRFDIVLRGKDSLVDTLSHLDQDKFVSMINKDIKYAYYLDLY